MENSRLKSDCSNRCAADVDELVQGLIKHWPSQLGGHLHLCVGLSGGIDSVVLLHLLSMVRQMKPLILSAIHVNHGLSPFATEWSEFCRELCAALDIPLVVNCVQVVKEGGQGLENSARKFRYRCYANVTADVIVLAHHQDDQIETILSQLMRGSDIHNLSGMQAWSTRGQKYLWRPLLKFSKRQLLVYAHQYNLAHITDESNLDNRYLRNFLRNQIIPQLVGYDGNVITKMTGSIRSLQQSCELNDELAQLDLVACHGPQQLAIAEFSQLSFLRQTNLLSYYLRQQQLPLPSTRQIGEFIRQINTAAADRHPQLVVGDKILCKKHNLITVY